MMTRRVVAALSYLLLLAVPALAQLPASRRETNVPRDIAAFEESDRVSPPPKGEVVFVGSSTVVLWDLPNQFPDIKAIGRGMWGSTLADTVRNIDPLVIAHEPRLVVVYAGENDIDVGSTSEVVAIQFEQLVKAVHAKLPATRILFIGLKPTIRRWLEVDRMRLANDLIRSICERDDRLAYLDVDGIMMGWDERPRRELFQNDGLHLSTEGYRLLSIIVRPFLVPAASPAPTGR